MGEKHTYWLLEKVDLNRDGKPSYLDSFTPDGGYTQTGNPDIALRWLTRTEARLAKDKLLLQYRNHFNIAEHVFTVRDDWGWIVRKHSHKKSRFSIMKAFFSTLTRGKNDE